MTQIVPSRTKPLPRTVTLTIQSALMKEVVRPYGSGELSNTLFHSQYANPGKLSDHTLHEFFGEDADLDELRELGFLDPQPAYDFTVILPTHVAETLEAGREYSLIHQNDGLPHPTVTSLCDSDGEVIYKR